MSQVERLLESLETVDTDAKKRLREWYNGQRPLSDIQPRELLNVLKEVPLTLRLRQPDGRLKDITVMSGDLMQVNKGEESTSFATAYGMWEPEFSDVVFSGAYADVTLVPYMQSGFQAADGFEYSGFGDGDSV